MGQVASVQTPQQPQGFTEVGGILGARDLHRQPFDPPSFEPVAADELQCRDALDPLEALQCAALAPEQVPGERTQPPAGVAAVAQHTRLTAPRQAAHRPEQVALQDLPQLFGGCHGSSSGAGNSPRSLH